MERTKQRTEGARRRATTLPAARMMTPARLASWLSRRREALGLTSAELAARADVPKHGPRL